MFPEEWLKKAGKINSNQEVLARAGIEEKHSITKLMKILTENKVIEIAARNLEMSGGALVSSLAFLQSFSFRHNLNEISAEMEQIIPIKGSVIQKMYPKDCLRDQTDIDWLCLSFDLFEKILAQRRNADDITSMREYCFGERNVWEATMNKEYKGKSITVDVHYGGLYMFGGIFLKIEEDDISHIVEGEPDDSFCYLVLLSQIASDWKISMRDINDAYILAKRGKLEKNYLDHRIREYHLELIHAELCKLIYKVYKYRVGCICESSRISISGLIFRKFCFGRENRCAALPMQMYFLFCNYREEKEVFSSICLAGWNILNYLTYGRAFPKNTSQPDGFMETEIKIYKQAREGEQAEMTISDIQWKKVRYGEK